MDHPDVPGRRRCRGHGGRRVAQRAVRGALGAEDPAVDDGVEGRQVDRRVVRVEDGDHAVAWRRTGHRRQVVGAVDRGPVVDVVRARDDDRPDPRVSQACQLRGDALDRAARLDVRVEQVAGDQEEVDLLGDGEVDGRLEGGELSLALRCGLLTEIVVSRAEVDVRGVDDPEHRSAALPPRGHRLEDRGVCHAGPGCGPTGVGPWRWRERGAPMTPRSPTPMSVVIVTGTVSRSPARRRPAKWPREDRFERGSAFGDPFSQPVVSSRSQEPVRPRHWDSTSAPGPDVPASFANPRDPAAHVGRPNLVRSAYQRAPGGRLS